ncbi:hypothetical protein GCM10027431_23900 [Lysobacter rhizosphaerae]
MSLTSQQYAGLAKDAYTDYPVGIRPPDDDKGVPIEGITYKIYEHVDNPRTGYQGTIYERVDTGDLVVAHRGTEQMLQDGALADGRMVLARANLQAADAIALTRRAVERAATIGDFKGRAHEVTVTGHSLGGCLAQITAHYFNLKGETFNAYGAVGLEHLRIPEGGNAVINHVMAADPVSAAGAHYGQVRVYATPQQIITLSRNGYENDRDFLFNERAVVLAAGASVGYHSISNFLNEDHHRSVLADPHARQLAQQFDPMIDRYRGDVALTRGVITLSARGPAGWVQDGYDSLRGPLAPGAPAAHDAHDAAQRAFAEVLARQDRAMRQGMQHHEPIRSGLPLPDYLTPDGLHAPLREPVRAPLQPFSDARHPQHALYEDVRERLADQGHHFPEDRLTQITAALHNTGTKAGWDGPIKVKNDQVIALDYWNYASSGVTVRLDQPAPSIQASMEGVQIKDQLKAERHEAFVQQQQQQQARGHGRSM